MAHRLVPKAGRMPLEPDEVVRRLVGAFAFVEADREAGARHIDQMVAAFEGMRAPAEIIEDHRRKRETTLFIVVGDDPASEDACLRFAALPGESLLIGYHSGEHQEGSRETLEKCAQVLDYQIEWA